MIPRERIQEALKKIFLHPARGDARAKAAYEEAQKIAQETGVLVGEAVWALATAPDPKKKPSAIPDKPDPDRRGRAKDRVWSPPVQPSLFGGV